jgi:hypothetical protein
VKGGEKTPDCATSPSINQTSFETDIGNNNIVAWRNGAVLLTISISPNLFNKKNFRLLFLIHNYYGIILLLHPI